MRNTLPKRATDQAEPGMSVLLYHIRDLTISPSNEATLQHRARESSCGSTRQHVRPMPTQHDDEATVVQNAIWLRSTIKQAHVSLDHQLLDNELAHAAPPTRSMCAPCGAWQPGERHHLSALGWGDPSPLSGLTRVVSTTNWTPPNSGKPSATISKRLPSCT